MNKQLDKARAVVTMLQQINEHELRQTEKIFEDMQLPTWPDPNDKEAMEKFREKMDGPPTMGKAEIDLIGKINQLTECFNRIEAMVKETNERVTDVENVLKELNRDSDDTLLQYDRNMKQVP